MTPEAYEDFFEECLGAVYTRLVTAKLLPPQGLFVNDIRILNDRRMTTLQRYQRVESDVWWACGRLKDSLPQSVAHYTESPNFQKGHDDLRYLLKQPLEEMPLYVGHSSYIIRTAVAWRLEVGR